MKELLEVVFAMRTVPRFYKQDKPRIWLVVRQLSAIKSVNTEAAEATALEAVTRQRLVKIQQTEQK
jgi:hypothetical protein